MATRYMTHVPEHHRSMIHRLRIRKPNWFVGSAEHPSVPLDPALIAEINGIKLRLLRFQPVRSGARGERISPRPKPRREVVPSARVSQDEASI